MEKTFLSVLLFGSTARTKGNPDPRFHPFSSWLPNVLLAYARVTGYEQYLIDRLPDLDRDYAVWENERRAGDGLF